MVIGCFPSGTGGPTSSPSVGSARRRRIQRSACRWPAGWLPSPATATFNSLRASGKTRIGAAVSTRKARVVLSAAVGAALASAWWLPCATHLDPMPFTLCVTGAQTTAPRMAHVRLSPSLLTAVALGMTDEERAQLGAILEHSRTRWEGRANPLLEDFEDDDPDAELEAWISHGPPLISAAMAASVGSYCGVDGFCVDVVPRGDRCPRGSVARESERERARFLAWPFGYAVLVRVPAGSSGGETAHILRAAARRSTRIGLVIAGADEETGNAEPLPTLAEHWRRHDSWKEAAQHADGGSAHAEEGAAAPPFPANLDRRDVLVMPQFGAIQTPDALVEEVRPLAPTARVTSLR